MTLATLFSLKTVEPLENRLQPHPGATLLFSMRTELQVSSQSCRSIDADAWYKRALKALFTKLLAPYLPAVPQKYRWQEQPPEAVPPLMASWLEQWNDGIVPGKSGNGRKP